jgi:hypothetical protein
MNKWLDAANPKSNDQADPAYQCDDFILVGKRLQRNALGKFRPGAIFPSKTLDKVNAGKCN